ncbi:MAG: STAS domain-containing protein [Gammaproteobacteria bacterium]|nr:STAS domain-containing protein [Gammaproteobacteria bacterium]
MSGRRVHAYSVELPAVLSIAGAAALHQALVSCLDKRQLIELDASAVLEADTAGLQLLAAFLRDRRESGRDVRWKNVSEPLVRAAGMLGLQQVLVLPEAGASQ